MTAGRGDDVGRWLDELDAAREVGTPGEWFLSGLSAYADLPGHPHTATGNGPQNAALIVAAVNALPRLVQIVRAVEALCVRAETEGAQSPNRMFDKSLNVFPAAVKVDDLRAALAAAMSEGAT